MANTIRPYTGDGTTVLYPVDFDLGYIRKSHIYVYLEGNDHAVQLGYTYISDVQIQLVTPVANGTVFNIRRVVPRDSLVNDYEDGAALHEGNLDNSFKQALMIQEELSDGFANLDGSFNVLANIDLKDTFKGINSVDPVNAGDLVTLRYLQTIFLQPDPELINDLSQAYTFDTVALFKASLIAFPDGKKIFWKGYYAESDGGSNWGIVKSGAHTDDGGSIFTRADGKYVEANLKGSSINIRKFGAFSTDPNDGPAGTAVAAANGAAILAAKAALRTNPVSILDQIGGSTITVYASGTLYIPRGSFTIFPDTLNITQDLGLTIRGDGSRRTNNAAFGASELKVVGTSADFAFRVAFNGGRGCTLEDFDLTYDSTNFTGYMIDNFGAQGLTLNRMYVGTHGITGGTRLTTAKAIFRCTYDEFMHCTDCVFSGAIDGWWSDDSRDSLGNTFGGFDTTFENCVFYDFTGKHYRHDGLRTRQGLTISRGAVNPITTSCDKGIAINNLDGLDINRLVCVPSTAFFPTNGWLDIENSTGKIDACAFGDLTNVGSISGNIDFSNNKIFCTDGVEIKGGIITGSGNEFAAGTNGYIIAPTIPLSFELGNDQFKAAITNSYKIAADSVNLSGKIRYASGQDASTGKFINVSNRVTIGAVDEQLKTSSSATLSVSILDTGRTTNATGGAAQTFTLPTPIAGTSLSFTKLSAQDLTIAKSTGYIACGVGGAKNSVLLAAVNVGGNITFKANGSAGWLVSSEVGGWAYS